MDVGGRLLRARGCMPGCLFRSLLAACGPAARPAARCRGALGHAQVRAGTGGDEAALFAHDLFRMYQRFAEAQRWRFEVRARPRGRRGALARWRAGQASVPHC